MKQNYDTYTIHRVMSRAVPKPNGCLKYQDGKTKNKYGLISVTYNGVRKNIPVHRALWMATHKCFDLPSDQWVCHRCDNPGCVNIDHLFLGTARDNMRDCIAKQRMPKVNRSYKRVRKFTDKQIREIRSCKYKTKYICEMYDVSSGYVSKLRRGTAKPLVR